jgi:DNA mismatch repair protein MutL
MPKVRILPDRVANQIAAGEVIERPAAVVKELVENALDAGATRIEVEFRHGGRSLMRIEDNGCGMSRDDALLALERHATSKINEADDLNRLASYGFRGEALPSIASVSRFTLQTREAGADLGTEILVNGGHLVHVRECGKPVGTRMEVAQLFHPVPARRKFLKTDQTEAAHIIQCVRLYALACPQVSFTLLEDGRTLFRSPECSTLVDRVGEIFGRQFSADLVPIEAREGDLVITGLIGKPGAPRPTRHEMIVFVNGRPVDSRTLNYALIESYHEHIAKGRYPMAFVFFSLDPAAVDVNVHPAKREIRFRNEQQVRSFVIRSVMQRLRELGREHTPAFPDLGERLRQPELPASMPVPPAPLPSRQAPMTTEPVPRSLLAASATTTTARPSAASIPVVSQAPAVVQAAPSAPAPTAGPRLGDWRFIGLAHSCYALFESPSGLVILERRAALERIWFERLLQQYGAGSVSIQKLLLPSTLELDAVSSAMLLDRLEFVQAHGFEVVEFGRNFFRLEAIPDWMEPGEALDFVRELVGALREGRFAGRDAQVSQEEFARLAASRAVRLPARVTDAEMIALLRELFATRAPLSSPAGRPTFVEMSHGELSRRLEK